MKIKTIVCSALAVACLAGCAFEQPEQAELHARAKISKETAQATAQAEVPDGTVKESELEIEKGKLIWSFCFTIPDSKDIKEVNVDAITGDVAGEIETETPADQAKDAAKDAAKAKRGEDRD